MAKLTERLITAKEALHLLMKPDLQVKALDVRSENEFAQGAIPNFFNAPILNNNERHQVGLCYKQQGQDATITLGHQLVENSKEQRVQSWKSTFADAEVALVACWRGGLRSKIASEWLRDAGVAITRVEGGYKALRHELIRGLSEYPPLLVIAGATGTGKTKLLLTTQARYIDLEGLAVHKGSAFGRDLRIPQPSQATFENEVAFQFLRDHDRQLMIEDESLVIGNVHIPVALKDHMRASPTVKIVMELEDRVTNILEDYIIHPLQSGILAAELEAYYLTSLGKIKNKLGGLKESELRASIVESFRATLNGGGVDGHRFWIRELLSTYYDRTYDFAFNKTPRNIVYEGDWDSCQTWIQNQYGSLKR